ncbi:MAG: apolipoprotein N-acyltransferase [Neisseriales bacterium]|nr:MAG: apolipoprotein N-acyltransferase [Neisseriales bacterium]
MSLSSTMVRWMSHYPRLVAWLRTLYPPLCIALSGLLLVFALAPFRHYWLAPLSLFMPLRFIQKQPGHAFRYGYLWGLAAYGACFGWIYYSLLIIAQLSFTVTLLAMSAFVMYIACYPAIALWITCRVTTQKYWRWLMVFPATWTLTEWLRGKILTGFPWGEMGLTQIAEGSLSGITPLLGIHGVTLFLMISTGILILLSLKPSYKVAVVLTSGLLLGNFQAMLMKNWAWTTPVGQPIRVALAQSNVPQQLKQDPAMFYATLNLYQQQIEATQADLMIFPESLFLTDFEHLPLGYIDHLKQLASYRHMSIALGVLRGAPRSSHIFNTVMSLDTQAIYAKRHLVPFGEYAPWSFTEKLYRQIKKCASQTLPGNDHQTPLALATQRIAFNICYEDSFGEELIHMARQSTMLANLSNLAWFGPHSIGLDQHLQLSQARALENGRFMLRATNTGRTAIITPKGQIAVMVPTDKKTVLVGQAQGYTGWTPYMHYGDYPVLALCIGLLVLASLWSCLKKRYIL